MLMRPEAVFPYVFAAEGAQHLPKRPPRSTNPCRHAAAGGPFSEVMVDSRGVTFIKNELFLLYSQVIIKECVYGYRSSVENGQGAYSGE